MCRGKEHGGRRCPEDNPVKRRVRRRNSSLIDQYIDTLTPSVEPPTVTPVEKTDSPSIFVEVARRQVEEYTELRNRIGEPSEVAVFHDTQLTPDEVLAEKKIIELGTTIDIIARNYDYPSEEQVKELDEWITENEGNTKANEKKVDMDFYKRTRLQVAILNGQAMGLGFKGALPISEAISERVEELGDDKEKIDDLHAAYEEWKYARANVNKEVDDKKAEFEQMIAQRTNAYRKALESVGVEFASEEDLKFKAVGDGDVSNLKTAATYYPKPWVENSNKLKKKLSITEKPGCRANYDDTKGLVEFDKLADDQSIITHELGHRMEHSNREVAEAERLFLNRRAGFVDYYDGKTSVMPTDDPIKGQYERGYYSAGFANDYSSKIYDFNKKNDTPEKREKLIAENGSLEGKGYYEVLTTGIESTFFGRHGGGLGLGGRKADPEHNRFILGLMASSAK